MFLKSTTSTTLTTPIKCLIFNLSNTSKKTSLKMLLKQKSMYFIFILMLVFFDIFSLQITHFNSFIVTCFELISQRVFVHLFFSFFLSFCTEWIWRGVAKVTTCIKNHPRRKDVDHLWSCRLTGFHHYDSQPQLNWKLRRDPIGIGHSNLPIPSAMNHTIVIDKD